MSLLDDACFQAHVAATVDKFNVPAVAVSLVNATTGKVDSKGFSLPSYDKVTEDTVFQICSNTKLFTAVAYGILVEEGRCDWDSRLCDLLPDFKLENDWAQQMLTVEDLLSHQSGLSGY